MKSPPFLSELFLSCMDAARRISEERDAAPGRSARMGLRLHLLLCAHCRRYARQIDLIHSMLVEYPEHLSRLKLPDTARAEIVCKLRELS